MKRSGPDYQSLDDFFADHSGLSARLGAVALDLDAEAQRALLDRLMILEAAGADLLALRAAVAHTLDSTPDPELAPLVDELQQLGELESSWRPADGDAEGLRRLLLALTNDVRVLLVAMADRLCQLREAANWPADSQQQFARRVSSIHIPLANRLGIWQFKWEMEDLVFRYLEPDKYQQIAGWLDGSRVEREEYIERLIANLEESLSGLGLQVEIRGRPKHIYSIWRKMNRKQLDFDQLFDLAAVRVMVTSAEQCYSVLGMVHSRFKPVPGEFDDYIANPKPNGYQSLHTAVFGPGGKPVEIQIRTQDMHDNAESGVAAHWRYKEGGGHDARFQNKLNAVRQMLEAAGEGEQGDFLDDFADLDDDERIYVLTPNGKVIDLRAGATVLDFAYHIHTDIGHRCRGAKVNNRIVPLTRTLKNGEQVEILTAREPEPSRDWMVPSLGYLCTPRARQKVRQWFKKSEHDRNVVAGKEIVQRDLKRLAVDVEQLKEVASSFNRHSLDSLYAAVGTGDVTTGQIANSIESRRANDSPESLPMVRGASVADSAGGDFLIEGIGNLMTQIGKCCTPVAGDPIIGYLTRSRGVTIHRESCPSLANLIADDASRLMQVSWTSRVQRKYLARVVVDAFDRPGLIQEIGSHLLACHADVASMETRVDGNGRHVIDMTLRVGDFDQLNQVLQRLNNMPGVGEASRVE